MSKMCFFILINIFYVNEIFNKELKIIYPENNSRILNAIPFIYGTGAIVPPIITLIGPSGNEVFSGTVPSPFFKDGNWGIQTPGLRVPLETPLVVRAETFPENQKSQVTQNSFSNFSTNYVIPQIPKPGIDSFNDPNEPLRVNGNTPIGASVFIKIVGKNSGKVFEDTVIATLGPPFEHGGEFNHTFAKGMESIELYNLNIESTDRAGNISVINFDFIPNKINEDGPSKPLVLDKNTVLDSGSPGFLGLTIPFSKITFTFEPEIPVEFITAKTNADKHGHYKVQVSTAAPLVPGRHKLIVLITIPSGESFAGTYFLTVPTTTKQDNLTKAIINKYGCKK